MAQACRSSLKAAFKSAAPAHAGLLLSRYLQDTEINNAKDELLAKAVDVPARIKNLYQHAFDRWLSIIGAEAITELIEIDGRAVIGLAAASSLEASLTLNHTYGTPLLPGSALKGLAAHYCHRVWGDRDDKFRRGGIYHQVIFGDTDDSGHIVFHDAWVTPESLVGSLVRDVMTVHHPEYYRGESDSAGPSDFDDPTPIPFLSVRGKYQVVLKCDVKGEEGLSWATLVMALLRKALETWGIGGKTNSGYGRAMVKGE